MLSVLSNTLLQHGGSVCSVSAQTTEDGYAVDLIGVDDLPADLRFGWQMRSVGTDEKVEGDDDEADDLPSPPAVAGIDMPPLIDLT